MGLRGPDGGRFYERQRTGVGGGEQHLQTPVKPVENHLVRETDALALETLPAGPVGAGELDTGLRPQRPRAAVTALGKMAVGKTNHTDSGTSFEIKTGVYLAPFGLFLSL